MPQIFQVLRCYKCLVFQVHQTKKSNKWECKLCGEKQSVKRHYGLGTAKDCRLHVQKLNALRGDLDELKCNQDQDSDDCPTQVKVTSNLKVCHQTMEHSKWANYIEEAETFEDKSNENISLGDAEVVLEIPKKRRKLNNNSFKGNPKFIMPDDSGSINKFSKKLETLSDTVSNDCIHSITKISQPDLHSKYLIFNQESTNASANITKKKFIPPVINKNSKWAQFAEDSEEHDETDIVPSPPIIETSQNDLLFSLCDDTNIDSILNI